MSDERSTADVCDELGDAARTCSTPLRRFGGRHRFTGPVRTVRCLGDNVLVREALSGPGDGRVLVVDGGGHLGCALLGDNMAALGAVNGWAGIVVNGAVRDAEQLGALDIGVMALGTNPRRSGKQRTGRAGEPVAFGGAVFRDGDVLHADPDGIVVVPAAP
jgi:regulator of ribonuclease activity A